MLFQFLKKNYKKLLVLTGCIFVIFLSVLLVCIIFVREKISDVEFLKNFVNKNYNLTLNCDTVDFGFSGVKAYLKTPHIAISDVGGKKTFIEADGFKIQVKILPLIFKRVALDEFSVDKIALSVARNKFGLYDFAKYIKFTGEKKIDFDLSHAKLSVSEYVFNFNDELIKNKYILEGNSLKGFGLDFNKKFAVSTKGCLVTQNIKGKRRADFLFDVDIVSNRGKKSVKKHEIFISGLDTSFLTMYFDKLGVKKTNAIIDIYSTAAKEGYKVYFYLDEIDIGFNYKNDKNTIQSKTPVIIDSDIDFRGSDFLIKNAAVLGENINISLNGKVKNALSLKNVTAEINAKVKNTQAHDVILLLPDTLFPLQEPYIKTLKMFNAHGIANASLNIKYFGEDDYLVNGEAQFDDIYLVRRPKNAAASFGKCKFKGRDVELEVYANAPNGAVVTVFGKTKMAKMPYGEFAIRSKGKLDMEFAQTILNPLQQILALKLGPLPFMKLKGNAEILLHTAGTKIKSKMNGYFVTNDATVSMQGINAVLTKGQVKVLFDNDKIIYNGAKGMINGAQTFIDGSADTQGNMNLDVKVMNISAKDAIHIAKTSYFVTSALDGGAFLESYKPNKGALDFYLNLSGNIPPDAVFGEPSENVQSKGKIVFNGVNLIVDPKIRAENLKGVLNFSNATDFDLTADIHNSPFKITGMLYQKGAKGRVLHGVPSILKIKFISDKLASKSIGNFIEENIELFIPQNRFFALNLAKVFKTNKFSIKGDIEAQGQIDPKATILDLSGFDFKGNVVGVNEKGSDCLFKHGGLQFSGRDVKFDDLRLQLSGIDFLMNGVIRKFASIQPYNDFKIVFNNSNFSSYAEMFKKILPSKIQTSLAVLTDFSGYASGNIKLKGTKIYGDFIPQNISFKDLKTDSIVELKGGNLKINNDKTYFSAINLLYDGIPVYFDGFIQTDGSDNPEFNLYVSTNLNENALDKLINPYLKYPVSLSGETTLKGRIQGRLNSYITYLTFVLNEGSDLSFMGLKLGDVSNKRELSSKIKFEGNSANIDYMRYFKYISSQNNKMSPYDLIRLSGGMKIQKDDIFLNNMRFVTPNPAPVRFLNPVFKKSIIKDGQFTSDLVLNGSVKNLSAIGNLGFSNVALPSYNSFVNNIDIQLGAKTGVASFKLSAFDTIGDFVINFENKTTFPFVVNDLRVHSNSVKINNLLKTFAMVADETAKVNTLAAQSSRMQTLVIKPSDVLIKKGSVTVDKILFNGVEAQNLKMNFSHSKDMILKIDNLYLAIAGGLIKGSGHYNFATSDIFAESDFINCDANEITKAFFNLSGQIFGFANGKFSIAVKNYTPDDFLNKINADAEFVILNGRMPKLGSIEYLLRTSNFFKSGIFGLTINNVIQLLTPYKNGDFEKIQGTFNVKNASIQDLKIYSQGEHLSTYTFGSYDIIRGSADMEVLGKLAKKVSNLLGPIGNASVVSVLNVLTRDKMDEIVKNEMIQNVNKIPLINLNNDEYRLFSVKLKGEITKEDIVKSFNWLN